MNRVAISFNTCDRIELTKRSIEPLLQPDKFDLHWFDGSKSDDGKNLWVQYRNEVLMHPGVRGGSGPAIVCALTMLLADNYDYIGLVENDVLLDADWFNRRWPYSSVAVPMASKSAPCLRELTRTAS